MNNVRLSLILLLTALIFSYDLCGQTDGQAFDFSITEPSDIRGSYEWGGTTNFGGSINEDFCAEMVWAGDIETLACSDVGIDLTGKIAVFRRGDCFFSEKFFYAEQAGAIAVVLFNHDEDPDTGPNEIFSIKGVDLAEQVTIPGIMVSFNSAQKIAGAINSGEKVVGCFQFSTLYDPIAAYSYYTPQSQIVPLENMAVSVVNRDNSDKTGVVSKIEVTEPNGSIVEISSTNDLPVNEKVIINFGSYTPNDIGEYHLRYISGHDQMVVERKFEITEYTWGLDNGVIVDAVGPEASRFEEAAYFYQHGNLVITANDAIVSQVSFGLGNAAELFSDDPSSDLILIAIYNADRDGNGQIDNFGAFDELGDPIGIGVYSFTGEEIATELVTVNLEDPVMLAKDGLYYVSIAYDGLGAGTGIPPRFSASDRETYVNFTDPLQIEKFFSEGWSRFTLVTRLHLEGFTSAVDDFSILDNAKLKLYNNPVSNGKLTFSLQLDEPSSLVDIKLRDINGRLVNSLRYINITTIDPVINVGDLSAGTYFLNVLTDEGFQSRKIMIAN